MRNTGNVLEEFKNLKGRLSQSVLMSRHTTMHVGGPCRALYQPESLQELTEFIKICRSKKISWLTIGKGSNILVSDSGTGRVLIKLSSDYFRKIEAACDEVTCGAGILLNELCHFAEKNSLSGCEFSIGIPGTIGGAIAQNAGACGRSFSDIIKTVTCVTENGMLKVLKKSDINFQYRASSIKGMVIISAVLSLKRANKAEITNTIKSYIEKRLKTQDYTYPSAGCIFKNPQNSELSAGRMIDMCGLRGSKIGGASISGKHANFIINRNKAKAEDVLSLIDLIKSKVKQKFEIELEEEVEIIS